MPLSQPTKDFRADLAQSNAAMMQARLVSEAHPLPGAERLWRIHPIDVPDEYAAALGVEGGCNSTTVTIR